MEDLRQKCLHTTLTFNQNATAFFNYIERVHSTCYTVINEDCSRRAHEHLGLDWDKTVACVADSFSCAQGSWEKSSCRNSIIDEEIGYWKEYGTNMYPAIVINKKTYRGQIEPLSVFNALCSSFQTAPKVCAKILNREPTESVQNFFFDDTEGMVTVWEVSWMILALIVVNVVIVYCCRRRARRDMQNSMNVQIESQVSQYFALTQTANKNRTSVI